MGQAYIFHWTWRALWMNGHNEANKITLKLYIAISVTPVSVEHFGAILRPFTLFQAINWAYLTAAKRSFWTDLEVTRDMPLKSKPKNPCKFVCAVWIVELNDDSAIGQLVFFLHLVYDIFKTLRKKVYSICRTVNLWKSLLSHRLLWVFCSPASLCMKLHDFSGSDYFFGLILTSLTYAYQV